MLSQSQIILLLSAANAELTRLSACIATLRAELELPGIPPAARQAYAKQLDGCFDQIIELRSAKRLLEADLLSSKG